MYHMSQGTAADVSLCLLLTIREYLRTGYGLRFSTEICGSKREKKACKRIPAGSLVCSYSDLRKSPEASGNSREKVI